jgi:hypothetical protein
MKVCFLDIDGVLNSREYFKTGEADRTSLGPARYIDPAAVRRLNRLLSMTGAVVVVSSAWRIGRSVAQLEAILRIRDFTGLVIDKTTVLEDPMYQRGDEIRLWLNDNPVESFIVLDDNHDMDAVRNHFIPTDPGIGLTDEDVEKAALLLTWGPGTVRQK